MHVKLGDQSGVLGNKVPARTGLWQRSTIPLPKKKPRIAELAAVLTTLGVSVPSLSKENWQFESSIEASFPNWAQFFSVRRSKVNIF